MLVILFLQVSPPVILLTLVLALYLTVVELREMEPRPHYTRWIWWLLLVFMTHFVGYLILRVYVFVRGRHPEASV